MIRPPQTQPTAVPWWRVAAWLVAAIPLLVVFAISGIWQAIDSLRGK